MSNIIQDQINLYLLNRLSPEEKVAFEKQMENDLKFKKEVLFQKEIAEAVQYKKSADAKAEITSLVQDWGKYIPEPELNETATNFKQSVQQNIENFADTLNTLIAEFFNPYPAAFRNAAIEQLSIEDQAFYYYNRKDYLKAIPLLQKLPKDDQEVQVMIGNAYLTQQDYKTALLYFKNLIEDEAVFFLNQAHWFAGLCQLGLNQIDEAQNHIQYLINNENTSKETLQNAHALMNKLSQQL